MDDSGDQNLRNALELIRLAAGLHYMGGAFEPEHMRSIANIATDALNGETIPPLPDPEDARKGAVLWASLHFEDDPT